MYAIVKNGDGTYYTSAVFGEFCRITAEDDKGKYHERVHNWFYVVLDREKKKLVKKYVYPAENKYLDPRVLVTDCDKSGWVLDEKGYGCSDFLAGTDFYADEPKLTPLMLKRCIEEDAAYTYKEVVDVESDTDLKNLDCAAGGFHDAYVEKAEKNGDSVYVLFGGVWGCEVEMFFDGDADFCIDARSGEHDDPYWFDSTLFRDGEYIYLADAEKLKPGDITNNYCWFRGKHLKYRIIPGE